MYMTPALSVGGGLCPTQAMTKSIAFASKHIGSGPGVSGASGMQVKPLVPLRNSAILPSAPIVTIAASLATAAGAADSALAMGSLAATVAEAVGEASATGASAFFSHEARKVVARMANARRVEVMSDPP